MALLVYFIYLLCTITHGHPDGGIDLSSWPVRLPEQDLAKKTGQPERIPMEPPPQGFPAPFIQADDPALQKPRREKRDLDKQIQDLASKYRSEKVKQCCHDGRQKYSRQLKCEKTLNQLENLWERRCHTAFKLCCFHAMEYYAKPMYQVYYSIDSRRKPIQYSHRIISGKDVYLTSAYNHSIKLEEIVSPRRLAMRDERSDFWTSLDTEIADVVRKYENDTIKKCCSWGKWQYLQYSQCMKNAEEPQCSAAIENCCFHVQEFFQKPRRVGLDIHLKSSTGWLEFKIVEKSEEMVTAEPTQFNIFNESESVSGGKIWRPQKTFLQLSIAVARKYKTLTIQHCCYDGYAHYFINSECMRRPEEDEEKKEEKEKREWLCHATFQTCCFRAQDYLQNPHEIDKNMNLMIYEYKLVAVKTSEFRVSERVDSAKEEKWRQREASLKEDILHLANNYKSDEEKRCCHDGYQHYIMNVECLRRLDEKETEATRKCYNAFRDCCFHAQSYLWYFP